VDPDRLLRRSARTVTAMNGGEVMPFEESRSIRTSIGNLEGWMRWSGRTTRASRHASRARSHAGRDATNPAIYPHRDHGFFWTRAEARW